MTSKYENKSVWVDNYGASWRVVSVAAVRPDPSADFMTMGEGDMVAWWDRDGNCKMMGGVLHQFGRRLERRVR